MRYFGFSGGWVCEWWVGGCEATERDVFSQARRAEEGWVRGLKMGRNSELYGDEKCPLHPRSGMKMKK